MNHSTSINLIPEEVFGLEDLILGFNKLKNTCIDINTIPNIEWSVLGYESMNVQHTLQRLCNNYLQPSFNLNTLLTDIKTFITDFKIYNKVLDTGQELDDVTKLAVNTTLDTLIQDVTKYIDSSKNIQNPYKEFENNLKDIDKKFVSISQDINVYFSKFIINNLKRVIVALRTYAEKEEEEALKANIKNPNQNYKNIVKLKSKQQHLEVKNENENENEFETVSKLADKLAKFEIANNLFHKLKPLSNSFYDNLSKTLTGVAKINSDWEKLKQYFVNIKNEVTKAEFDLEKLEAVKSSMAALNEHLATIKTCIENNSLTIKIARSDASEAVTVNNIAIMSYLCSLD